MNAVTMLGLFAGFCTTIAFLPQVVRIYRTRHTRDLSLPMYTILTFGVILWVFYGLLLHSLPVILANGIVFFLSAYILVMKIRYK